MPLDGASTTLVLPLMSDHEVEGFCIPACRCLLPITTHLQGEPCSASPNQAAEGMGKIYLLLCCFLWRQQPGYLHLFCTLGAQASKVEFWQKIPLCCALVSPKLHSVLQMQYQMLNLSSGFLPWASVLEQNLTGLPVLLLIGWTLALSRKL